ncbi:MAG: hypothetical protein Q8K63_00805, partial [Acidimicrobiales bacterium]|nr:hypothetical protein [Acidimicrobiales bacterium]
MIPLGVAGQRPLSYVDASGYLHDVDGTRLEWWILGDDQWHAPAATPSLRQSAVEHTPVIETSIRVPGGDVVWRVGAAVEGVVLECENRATIPVAVGLALVDHRGDVRDLEVFPVTHGTTWRRSLSDYTNRNMLDLTAVTRGWQTLAARGASIVMQAPTTDDALAGARVSLLLHQGALIAAGKKADRSVAAAVNNALEYLGYEDEASDLRAACKIKPQRRGLPLADAPSAEWSNDSLTLLSDAARAAATVKAIRDSVVDDSAKSLDIAPGFAESWRGASVDITDLPTNHGPLSFAIRWHGEK